MIKNINEIFGIVAAICSTAAFVPQAIKTIKSRSTKDISLYMYLLMTVGVFCWLMYGIYLDSIPMMIANAITLVFVVPILVMKIRYK